MRNCNFFRKYVTIYMKDVLKRRSKSKVEKQETTLKEYIKGNKLDIERLIEQYYSYVYRIIKSTKSVGIVEEDIEEIISDVFLAIWKNSANLTASIRVKPYLGGITKNVIRNKYRKTTMHCSISDYEEHLVASHELEMIIEEREQNEIIKGALKMLKLEEYQIFIAFYYENKKVKEIAKILGISESKVKVILHRVRKDLKAYLKKGGYSYERE